MIFKIQNCFIEKGQFSQHLFTKTNVFLRSLKLIIALLGKMTF